MNKVLKYFRRLQGNVRQHKRAFVIYTILQILMIGIAIRQIWWGNYQAAVMCLLSLLLFLLPSFVEEQFKIEIPPLFEVIIYFFIFAAEVLGEVGHFYVFFQGLDTVLHTINGFLCAAIGFSLIDLLNRNSKNVKLSPFYLALVAFCFSMTIGVVWEFFEFGADMILGQDMQKDFIVQSFQSVTLDPTHSQQTIAVRDILSTVIHTASGDITVEGGYLDIGIIDTMKDLFVNLIGAVVFSLFGYFYEKGHEKAKIAAGLLVRTTDASDEKANLK